MVAECTRLHGGTCRFLRGRADAANVSGIDFRFCLSVVAHTAPSPNLQVEVES